MTRTSLRTKPYLSLAVLMLAVVGLLAQAMPAQAQTADLTITKTGPATTTAGEAYSYTITVTNSSTTDSITVPEGTVLVRDTLTNATVNSWSPASSYRGSTTEFRSSTINFSATVDDVIAPGQSRTFRVSVIPEDLDTITNTATLDPNGAIAESNEDNNTATVTTTITPGVADLSITKTDSPDPVVEGQTLTYTLEATNNGPTDNASITVTDQLPANTEYISSTVSGSRQPGSCTVTRDPATVTCELGLVFRGDTPTVEIVVRPISAGTITNTATVSSNGAIIDNNSANDSATITTTVTENDPPVAVDDSYSTDEDTPLTVRAPGVLSNDTDEEGSSLTAAKVSDPTNGTLTLNADGSFTYTPNANFSGSDSFTYKASDGLDDSNTATVTITVKAVNDTSPPRPSPPQPEPVPSPSSGSQRASVTMTGDGNEVSVDQSIRQNAFSPQVATKCQQQASGTQQCPGVVDYGEGNSAVQQVE